MKYKLIIMIASLLIIMSATATAQETTFAELYADRTTAKTDGKIITIEATPVINNERMLVPIRAVSEIFGFTVQWDESTKGIAISNDNTEINISIGSRIIRKTSGNDNSIIETDVEPIIINDYTMVPIRFIADAFNYNTYWDETQRRAVIASRGWGAKKIGIDEITDYLAENGRLSNGITVAVIDTGVDCEHIYLRNRIIKAYNVADKSNQVSDLNGHGTHVAGIIANCTPETVKIMPVRVYDANGICSENMVAEGIRYAVHNGAHVINISMEKSLERGGNEIENAINEAVRRNCTVVVAAGNDGDDASKYTPANIENAIVITAVDKNDARGEFNYGRTITAAAPGIGIVSSYNDGSFAVNNGTSMAAAYASAAAALITIDISGVTPNEIKNMFIRYSRDAGEKGRDDLYGAGVIDLSQYVQNRRNNIINDFSVSAQEQAEKLDAEIEVIRRNVNSSVQGLSIRNSFAVEMINRGVRRYNSGEYFASGYFFEKSIEEGDSDKSLAKNNLAFLLRRGYYVSSNYNLEWLLSKARAEGNTLAFINDALLQASRNNWNEADLLIKECVDTCRIAEDDIDFWKILSNNNDFEGDLVLGWLMRYGWYKGYNTSQKEYIDRAKKAYPSIPAWMYESAI